MNEILRLVVPQSSRSSQTPGDLLGIWIPGPHPRPGKESKYLIPASIFIQKFLRYLNDLEISYRLPDMLPCLIYLPRKKGKAGKQNCTVSFGRMKILEGRS